MTQSTQHRPAAGAGGTAPPQQTNGATEAPAKKPRAPQAKRIPDGMVLIKFLLTKEENDKLGVIADLDDRKAEDLARVLTRKYIRNHKDGNEA